MYAIGRKYIIALTAIILFLAGNGFGDSKKVSDVVRKKALKYDAYVSTCKNFSDQVTETDFGVCFSGAISSEMVNKAIFSLSTSSNNSIVINSPGGDVLASIKFGLQLNELGTTVIVHEACYSSCANYIAIAAKKLVVTDGAIIGMHGSPYRNFGDYAFQQIQFMGIDPFSGFDSSDPEIQSVFGGYREYASNFILPETEYFADLQANESYIHRYWESLRNVKLYGIESCQPEGGFIMVVNPEYFREFRTLNSVEYFWWPENKQEVIDSVLNMVGETTILLGLDLMPSYVPSKGRVAQEECLLP